VPGDVRERQRARITLLNGGIVRRARVEEEQERDGGDNREPVAEGDEAAVEPRAEPAGRIGEKQVGGDRILIPVATIVALVVVPAVLVATDLLVLVVARPGSSNVPTMPPCTGRYIAEGFTYRFRDPHRGELVVIHARVDPGFNITPDPQARDLNLTKRVIGVPGDTVVGRNERVFVNGRKADDIPTDPFPSTHLGAKQYFVLGDNRSESQDSRAFGPVPRAAILGRVFLIYWPLGRFETHGYNTHLVPPGQISC
jgi:signal peptidase I